jgi:hypothetical protein
LIGGERDQKATRFRHASDMATGTRLCLTPKSDQARIRPTLVMSGSSGFAAWRFDPEVDPGGTQTSGDVADVAGGQLTFA